VLRTPKRSAITASGKARWYGYYPGFSVHFVQDVITSWYGSTDLLICDPWNGSGTTTEVANELGCSAIGYDLNPAMVVIAKARLLGSHTKPSHAVLCRHILNKAASYPPELMAEESLTRWFAPASAEYIRNIERATQNLFVNDGEYSALATQQLGNVSSLACFFYVALFQVVRSLLTRFRATNPTWLKTPKEPSARLRPTPETINKLFSKQIASMVGRLEGSTFKEAAARQTSRILVTTADSRALPLSDESVDAVISSPPYCTRIDYAIATASELAIIGYTSHSIREIRHRLLGTSTIYDAVPVARPEWGKTCNTFLEAVRSHRSHASESYYWKNHVQYFDGLFASLKEIRRILKPLQKCVLVVQDSYYKEIHTDLPLYVVEMGDNIGFSLTTRYDYPVFHTFAGMHTHRTKYRSHAGATEAVLVLSKQ